MDKFPHVPNTSPEATGFDYECSHIFIFQSIEKKRMQGHGIKQESHYLLMEMKNKRTTGRSGRCDSLSRIPSSQKHSKLTQDENKL